MIKTFTEISFICKCCSNREYGFLNERKEAKPSNKANIKPAWSKHTVIETGLKLVHTHYNTMRVLLQTMEPHFDITNHNILTTKHQRGLQSALAKQLQVCRSSAAEGPLRILCHTVHTPQCISTTSRWINRTYRMASTLSSSATNPLQNFEIQANGWGNLGRDNMFNITMESTGLTGEPDLQQEELATYQD